MSIRSILVVGLALLFGGSAALGVNAFLRQSGAAAPPQPDTVPVVVAADDVARFGALTPDVLVVRNYPKDLMPPGALGNLQDVVDRVSLVSLTKGEPIIADKISHKGTGRGLGAVIPKGMRAFTINTPNVASHVAGFILPGSKVDVLLTIKPNGIPGIGGLMESMGGIGTITTTLLQNMEILAVDQRVEAPSANKLDVKELRSVTLLVKPDQAAKLDMGQNAGTLHLSLRNPDDRTEFAPRSANLGDLQLFRAPQQKENKMSAFQVGVLQLLNRLTEPPKQRPATAARRQRQQPPAVIYELRGTQQGQTLLSGTEQYGVVSD